MYHKELNNRISIIKSNFNESTDNIFLVFEGNTKDEILDKSDAALRILKSKSNYAVFFSPGIFYPSNRIIEQRKSIH